MSNNHQPIINNDIDSFSLIIQGNRQRLKNLC